MLSVVGCPGVRCGIPVDLNGRGQGAPAVGSEAEQQVSPRTKNSRSPGAIGRLGGYKTLLEQPRQARWQANSSGISGCPATAMRLQGQAINYV